MNNHIQVFKLGERVKITSLPVYGGVGSPNDIGTIIRIRERYKNTPNSYNQYKVHIEGKHNSNIGTIDDLYNSFSLISLNEDISECFPP